MGKSCAPRLRSVPPRALHAPFTAPTALARERDRCGCVRDQPWTTRRKEQRRGEREANIRGSTSEKATRGLQVHGELSSQTNKMRMRRTASRASCDLRMVTTQRGQITSNSAKRLNRSGTIGPACAKMYLPVRSHILAGQTSGSDLIDDRDVGQVNHRCRLREPTTGVWAETPGPLSSPESRVWRRQVRLREKGTPRSEVQSIALESLRSTNDDSLRHLAREKGRGKRETGRDFEKGAAVSTFGPRHVRHSHVRSRPEREATSPSQRPIGSGAELDQQRRAGHRPLESANSRSQHGHLKLNSVPAETQPFDAHSLRDAGQTRAS